MMSRSVLLAPATMVMSGLIFALSPAACGAEDDAPAKVQRTCCRAASDGPAKCCGNCPMGKATTDPKLAGRPCCQGQAEPAPSAQDTPPAGEAAKASDETPAAPPGRGRGRGRGPGFGRGPDADFAKDRDEFHFLLANHEKIKREVTNREDGVETVTESDDPAVAEMIRKHVASMYKRVEGGRPIHMRDPLFAAVFRHADKIKMTMEPTAKGLRVTETSADPYVAKLIQAHAQVVNLFVKNGFDEPHRNHEVPEPPAAAQ